MGWLPSSSYKATFHQDRQVLPEEPTSQRDDMGSIVRWVRLSRQHRHSHSHKDCRGGSSIPPSHVRPAARDTPRTHTATL